MSYSAININETAPARGNTIVGALTGAAIGVVVGAVVLAAVVTVDRAVYSPSALYAPAATTVRPAVGVASVPANAASMVQTRTVASASYATAQGAGVEAQQVVMQAPQGISVYSWTWVVFAAIAGAVNGLFLWNRRVAMASTTGRREAMLAGVTAAAGLAAGPAFAAYGDAANVFGKSKDVEQYRPIEGSAWKGVVPGKFNPGKELEVPGTVARYEDNFDALNLIYIVERQVGKNSVTEVGGIDDVRNNVVAPLLGQQAFEGSSLSEGGFAPGRYASAAVLDQKQETKDGKTLYYYEFLTRTADGNEGGRHQLFVVGATNGKLVILKAQAGDKRWFKGLEKNLRKVVNDFRLK